MERERYVKRMRSAHTKANTYISKTVFVLLHKFMLNKNKQHLRDSYVCGRMGIYGSSMVYTVEMIMTLTGHCYTDDAIEAFADRRTTAVYPVTRAPIEHYRDRQWRHRSS